MKSENIGERKKNIIARSIKITPTYAFDSEARQALDQLLGKSAETAGKADDCNRDTTQKTGGRN
ncbi:MAG: hypothetical protein AB1485_07730 [Candidatus Thermoplasmatota archaeon]